MTKLEFENKVKKINIQKVRQDDEFFKLFGKSREIFIDNKNNNDIYGCFFEEKEKMYIIFFIDAERGIARDLGEFKTESEAYEQLFFYIDKWKKEI